MATAIDLRQLRLRPGEVRRERIDVDLDPFHLGGQRYEARSARIPIDVAVSAASGALLIDMSFDVELAGPCMRCLGPAEVERHVSAREFHDPDAPARDELRSDYVEDGQLEVGRWARDALALELPDQVFCRPDCLGLCPVCGKDLNVEPHEHAEREVDPRWAPLEELRRSL